MTDIASHRGGALLWPENSRLAFEQTARLPVEQVEFDVHPSRDGRLVVIHDATLERTTDGSGPVSAHDWAGLDRLILKGSGGQRMLLLDEVMEIFRPTNIVLRIEMKAGPNRVPYAGLPAKLVSALAAARMLERSVLTSFQLATVAEVPRHGSPMRHVWLVAPDLQIDVGLTAVIDLAHSQGVSMLGLHARPASGSAAGPATTPQR
jgi:glycerophosphoryl diester phosphodiesterase